MFLLLLNHAVIVVEPCCYCFWTMLFLLLKHVVIVVKPCCVEGLMDDRCMSNKHSR